MNRKLFSVLSGPEKTILFLGKVDTGKTTLVTQLANEMFSKGKRVGIIDADPGQSDIGPPGTIGLGFLKSQVTKLSEILPEKLAFIGSTSPGGIFLWPTVWGISQLVNFASKSADIIIIDSSGLITGRDGYVLAKSKVLTVHPDIVFFVGSAGDYIHLVNEFSLYTRVEVLPSPSGVRVKTYEERKANRIRMWKTYFRDSVEVELSWNNLEIGGFPYFGVGVPLGKEVLHSLSLELGVDVLWAEACNGKYKILTVYPPERLVNPDWDWMHIGVLRNTFVGLEGDNGLIDVGVILDIDERKLLIKTPLCDLGRVRRVLISKLKIDEEVLKE
ncbi:MAG: polynucleotide 5-hydroxyl-kinase [bacterium]|nr:polynucleotide 5-hydroxyl-kinase [bacterium]